MLEATIHPRTARRVPLAALVQRLDACREFPAVIQVPCDGDPLTWLAAQPAKRKLVWRGRGEKSLLAGLGTALDETPARGESPVQVLERCRHRLRGLPGQRFFGGFAFYCGFENASREWSEFGPARFWLPRLTWEHDALRLVVLDESDRQQAKAWVNSLVDVDLEAADDEPLPRWRQRTDSPNQREWCDRVAQVLEMFRNEVLEKIVLARRVDLDFDQQLDPIRLISMLASATPACYHFCFQLAPQVAFLGATPERLFLRKERWVESEVVAGTRPRGTTSTLDQELAAQLMGSCKDQLEHDIVRKSIRQRLHSCVSQLQVDARASVLKLASKQHLFSAVRGQLHDTVTDGDLIVRLHPTPAVGGYPTENALCEIRRLEPFERGWYAAPVGWIGADEAEFAVAIRSGLVTPGRLSLFSGAGIVPGSVAEAEWEEIEHKLSDFLRLIQPM